MPVVPRRVVLVVLWGLLAWSLGNAVYVYLIDPARRTYRVESAVLGLALLLLVYLFFFTKTQSTWAFAELGAFERRSLVALAIAGWAAIYAPLLWSPFLSDDYVFLERYRSLSGLQTPQQFFRPAFAVVFMLLARVGRGSPVPFHVMSLALHLASSWLVFLLSRRFFVAATPALIAFIVFLLNPLQLEAVLWPSGLQELLWTFFALAAVHCYVGSPTLSAGRVAGVAVLAWAALLSKETAVCLVVLLPAAEMGVFRRFRGLSTIVALGCVAGLVGLYWLIRQPFASSGVGDLAWPSRYALKQFVTLPYAVFTHPWNSSAIHVPGIVTCVAVWALLIGAFVAVVYRRLSSRALAGPAIILITTLPLNAYFYVREDLLSARYLYLPAFGWGLLLASIVSSAIASPRALLAPVALLGLLYGASLSLNTRPWVAVGELVDDVTAAVQDRADITVAIRDWRSKHPGPFESKDGVPSIYEGVGVFINGYPEFVRQLGRAQQQGAATRREAGLED